MRFLACLTLLYSILANFTLAQSEFVTGQVFLKDSQIPIPGVSVSFKNSGHGTTTDQTGKFSLPQSDNSDQILQFEYSGLGLKEISALSDNPLVVYLEEASKPQVSKETASNGNMAIMGDDLKEWSKWQTTLGKDGWAYQQNQWGFYLRNRITTLVENKEGKPVSSVQIVLEDEGNHPIWIARTDVEGKAEMWANLYGQGFNEKLYIKLRKEGSEMKRIGPIKDLNSILHITYDAQISQNHVPYTESQLVIAHSGSTELTTQFYKELSSTINTLKRSKTNNYLASLNVEWNNVTATKATSTLSDALWNALVMPRSERADQSFLFVLVTENVNQHDENLEKIRQAVSLAAAKGIRIIPVFSSTLERDTEFLLRFVACATNGKFVVVCDRDNAEKISATTLYGSKTELLPAVLKKLFTSASVTSLSEE